VYISTTKNKTLPLKVRRNADKQLAIKDITICPALIFATNRTVRVKGRIIILIVSIKIKKGVKAPGAPNGTRCAKTSLKLFRVPEIIAESQIVRAILTLNQRLVVTP